MKLKIYSESKEEQTPVCLKLVEGTNGDVRLVACDEEGNPVYAGNILDIREDGKIHLYPGVDPDLGFQRNHKGKVIVYDDDA